MKEEKFNYREWKIRDYLEQLSSAKSVPGGGSALAFAGTLSYSLILMAMRITLKAEKEKEEFLNMFEEIERGYLRFSEMIEEDSIFYNNYLENKTAESMFKIYQIVEEIALNSLKGIRYIEKIYPFVLKSIKSDLIVAVKLLEATFYGSKNLALNNLKNIFMKEEEKKGKLELLKNLEEELNFLLNKFKK